MAHYDMTKDYQASLISLIAEAARDLRLLLASSMARDSSIKVEGP